MTIAFTKYHGLGNDFILVDNRATPEPLVTTEQAVKLCDRHFGIGADGVIFALPGQEGADYTMRIFNNDGSEPEMCGNGIRCLARFIADLEGITPPHAYHTIHTLGGRMVTKLEAGGLVTVNMGAASPRGRGNSHHPGPDRAEGDRSGDGSGGPTLESHLRQHGQPPLHHLRRGCS